MELLLYGIDYKETSIELREKISFTTREKKNIIKDLLNIGVLEVLILSTCNRSEFYFVIEQSKTKKINLIIRKYFKNKFNIDFKIKFRRNKEVVSHIFKVASGLDSLVLGEDQILGQVKSAHKLAMDLGSSKKILNKLFLESITIAKRLKTKYLISERPLSISYIGVKFLKEKTMDLSNKNIMLIGLGKMGKLVLKNLLENDFNKLYMSNRSHEKVIDLNKISNKIIPFDYFNRYDYLKKVDILITATASPHLIFKSEKFKTRDKKLIMLDLAVPRDIDFRISKNKKYELYNIDHLKKIAEKNQNQRKIIAKKMMVEIESSVNEFINWKKTIKADPLIKKLNYQIKEIKNETIDIIRNKSELSLKDQSLIDKMLNSALKKVIRKPILNLKTTKCDKELEKYIESMKKLFEI